MIGLVSAELLKLRKRWATYIIPVVGMALMALLFFLIGSNRNDQGPIQLTRFPEAYTVINELVFGLGSLLALAYAAAVGGADWTWGIIAAVVARGEGRARYVLAKATGFGIVLFLGTLVAVAAGILFAVLAGNGGSGDPFGPNLPILARSIGYGTLVLLERCAIGFAIAFLLRSQLAGVIVGIVLYIGEGILTTVLTFLTIQSQELSGGDTIFGLQLAPQWYQFLPFNIGNQLLDQATPAFNTDFASVVLKPVPMEQALVITVVYLVGALAVAVIVTLRAQISG
jgi:hypothetical protein